VIRADASRIAAQSAGLGSLTRAYVETVRTHLDNPGPFERLFLAHPDPMLLIDPVRDRVISANPAAHRILGDTNSNRLLQVPASALFPAALPALIVFTESVIESGHGWTDEISCRTLDGRELAVEITAVRAMEKQCGPLLFTLRDQETLKKRQDAAAANDYVRRGLSEWRRVERIFQEIEHENQLILGAAGEGIYGVNTGGLATFVNPAGARMLGWSQDELVGHNMHELVHHTRTDGSHYHKDDCPIYAAFKDGIVHRVEDEIFWRKDGTAFPVEYTSTPIRDHGKLVGAVIVFRDISDRREAEAQLHAALAEVQHLKDKLELENAYLQEEIRAEHNYREIVGNSTAIRQVIRQIDLVAPTDANVLITGASGTGKELIARAIHEASRRHDRPLIRVNCAAVPRELFESEFFGHVRGAFTGATKERVGRFELADGGTLFLDEVGEIPLELQGKLLRVLQEGQFERVGDERTRKVNVRLIAATNKDLQQEVATQRFREDLYFRLNVFPLQGVPLRDRPDDIPLLASHFLQRTCRKLNVAHVRLTQSDIRKLQTYHWPGNVRELANTIERGIIVAQNGRLVLNLPEPPPGTVAETPATPLSTHSVYDTGILTEDERVRRDREMIRHALTQTGGKVFGPGGAAELLGVKPTTLASRIKRLGIEKPSAAQHRQHKLMERQVSPSN